ncbi:MAG: hypothetical protein Q8L86_05475 [Vicinamibacterales bacterium]|nr:hypothetical protein [Vicinamibacterales bacterium]
MNRALAAALIVAAVPVVAARQPLSEDDVLAWAREHAVTLHGQAAVIVAEEHSRQEAIAFRLPSRSRAAPPPGPMRLARLITGDLILMRLPGAPGWLTLRDIYEVDEEVVGERTDRVLNLVIESREAALAEAPFIYDDAGRHTLGNMPRVISMPTLALVALHPGYAARFRIRPRGVERIDGRTARVFEFEETGRPTLIPGPREAPFPLSGRVSVDQADGVILKTVTRASAGRLMTGTVTVTYARDPRLEAWLPVRMQDQYRQSGNPWNYRGETTYTNYRCYPEGADEPAPGKC